jgi:hypothetical protein
MRWLSIIALGPCVCTQGCRTNESRLTAYSQDGRCAQAAELLGPVKVRASVSESVKVAGGELSSYSLVGLGGAADIVLVYASSFIVGGVVCSPALLVDVPLAKATNGQSPSIWGDCTGQVMDAMTHNVGFPMGTAARDATAGWRTRNSDPISKAMSLVAECHLKSGDAHALENASKQVEIIKDDYYADLSSGERARVDELEARIQRLQKGAQSK